MSVTDRCSLRCVYCLPDNPGFAPNSLNSLELQRLTELVHAVVRVHKIRLTGGEPTLNDDLVDHLHHAKSIAPLVGLTTHGVLLEPLLPALRAGDLDRLNISFVRSTPPASAAARAAAGFRRRARRDGFERVLSAIRAAKQLGFAPLTINAVAMPDTDYAALARFAAFEGVHVRFIRADGDRRGALVADRGLRQRRRDAPADLRGRHLAERMERTQQGDRAGVGDRRARSRQVLAGLHHHRQRAVLRDVRSPAAVQPRQARHLPDGRSWARPDSDLRRGDDAALVTTVRHAVAGKRPPVVFERHGTMAAIGG